MLPRSAQVINYYNKSRFNAALIVCIAVLAAGCRISERQSDVPYSGEWRNGDIVFRCGWGAESKFVTAASHSAYSHVGILFYNEETKEWYVAHAVPTEDEPEWVKTEPVSIFFSSERARSGAWMRVNCSDSIAEKAAAYAKTKCTGNVLFDNEYLLNDTTQLYCTELVWRSYLQAGLDISGGRRHSVPGIFSKERECIFPNDIEQSETTLFVKHFK